jgi:2,3-bisphosphoglycerate-dependent phosphoglycerate mutase
VAAEATLAGLGGDAPVLRRDWRLNERHFGALQGMSRWEALRSFGPLQVMRIQGSYTLAPPPLEEDDPRVPALDALYAGVPSKELPLSESLADTYARVVPYWEEVIVAEARRGHDLLVVAHKNSLRVLMKHVEGVPDESTPRLRIATGEPLLYEFDDALRFVGRRHLVPQQRRFSLWPGISPA